MRLMPALLLLTLCALSAPAQKPKLDMDALINETQKTAPGADNMGMMWWMPPEFWEASVADADDKNPEVGQEIVKRISAYTVFLVSDGTLGDDMVPVFRTEAQIRATIQMKDTVGNVYKPIASDQADGLVSLVMLEMKPMLANTIGAMGKNMHMFLFPAKDKDGHRIADAGKPGKLTVLVGKQEYTWKLPLASVVPPKTCPKCGEKLSGAYSFCPYDGTKLP